MPIYTPDVARGLLQKEYPNLKIEILKQFRSFGVETRTHNTFLIKNTDSQKLFVAKGSAGSADPLLLEWEILKKLNSKKKNAPKLIFPNHVPTSFLIIEYIDANNAFEFLKENPNNIKIFSKIGDCLGKFHRTKANWFGNPIKREKLADDWINLMYDKIDSRVKGLKVHLDTSSFSKLCEYYESIRNDLIEDDIENPVLIHRDIYLDNFLISNKAILIDYGMSYGGRPWYDLGKFYVSDLYEYPKARNTFLVAYKKHIVLPDNFNILLNYYTFAELSGMIHSSKRHKQLKYHKKVLKIMGELIDGKGTISELINT